MARKPQQKRAKVTVEAIIEAGFICVSERGMEGTTTRHIADIAGISVGSLYEYFENKESVYRAMSQYFTDEVLSMLRDLMPQIVQVSLEEAIHLLFYRFTELLQKNDQRYLKCIRYAGNFDYDRYADQVESALMELVMRYVMHNQKYLMLPNIPTLSYICINGGIFMVVRHLILPNPNISFDDMVKGVTKMILSYVNAELASAKAAKQEPST
jgi:AcrR family transcriptional regulator